jgi:general secretion pathway protein G
MIVQSTIRRQARRAFTLMEMLVVVAIIVALSGIGGYYYFAQLEKSEDTKAKAQITIISKAVETYMIDHSGGRPPSLEALLQQDERGGPYLETAEAITTPWGGMYQYDPAGGHNNSRKPDVFIVNPRGVEIGNWHSGH